jgi:hypothetical protein
MEETRSEWAYYTLLGQYVSGSEMPGVENQFADGMECDILYGQMLEAYGRLRDRMGTEDEDPDVEIIISNLLRIQRLLCLKMFECAQQ